MNDSPFAKLKTVIAAAVKVVLCISIVLCIGLYVATYLHLPTNYLVPDKTSPTQGWEIHGAEVVQTDVQAPDGSKSALKVISTSGDGHLVLRSGRAPRNTPVTFSIYLRADLRTTIYIGVFAGEYVSKSVRIGQQWQRFSVTGDPKNVSSVSVLVGGARTFLEGDAIYVWGPQLDIGTSVGTYTSNDLPQPSWTGRQIERLGLQTTGSWLLLIATALLVVLVILSRREPPVRRVLSVAGVLASYGLRHYKSDRLRLLTITTYALIVIVTLLLMEIVAFTANVVLVLESQKISTLAAMRSTLERAAALVTAASPLSGQFIDQSTIFSPLTQVRRLPGDQLPPYHINHLGLVDNEGASPVLDTMPEKPSGMVRIILYGGSTAMGIGAPTGNQTLTARLEKLLNRYARPGTVFQVLNFGHGGSQSFSDLSFMVAMGTYLDPDVTISLNGFNDAFFATETSRLFDIYPYVIDWSDFSYYYHNIINGIAPPRPVAIAFLPFTSLLFNEIKMAQFLHSNSAKSFFDTTPMRLVSQNLDRTNPLRDRLLLENLRFSAGYFINRDRIFLSYLQPHPLQDRTLLSSEAALVEGSIARLSRHPFDEYRRRMIAQFDAYGERYRQLQREYAPYSNIRFFDIRNELRNMPEAAYIDIAHYSVAGQQRLAERMFNDLNSFELIRSRLVD